jgi:hypothetical protein
MPHRRRWAVGHGAGLEATGVFAHDGAAEKSVARLGVSGFLEGLGFLTPRQVGVMLLHHPREVRVLDVPQGLAGLILDQEPEI